MLLGNGIFVCEENVRRMFLMEVFNFGTMRFSFCFIWKKVIWLFCKDIW